MLFEHSIATISALASSLRKSFGRSILTTCSKHLSSAFFSTSPSVYKLQTQRGRSVTSGGCIKVASESGRCLCKYVSRLVGHCCVASFADNTFFDSTTPACCIKCSTRVNSKAVLLSVNEQQWRFGKPLMPVFLSSVHQTYCLVTKYSMSNNVSFIAAFISTRASVFPIANKRQPT